MDRSNLTTRLAEMGYASSEEFLESLARGHELRKETEVVELHCFVGNGSVLRELSFVRDGQVHLHRMVEVCSN